ncbi:MAG: SPOR domain-containing protein, partial [Luteimonas sp.]
LLQAGAFGAAGDAEALKARIALLGISASVENAEINGRAMHRVRMGPYAPAAELAAAKQRLGNGGLPALAIQAR